MKKSLFLFAGAIVTVSAMIWLTACEQEKNETTGFDASSVEDRSNPNSAIYPPNAQPNGKSYAEWSAEWWKWATNIPCATNPIFDATGENADINQSGPVYFLAGNTGGAVTRNVTIPHGKKILFPLINYLNDYPCPDPDFQPAPGQTMEEFLAEGAAALMDLAGELSVTLDGNALNNEEDYRFPSGLFYFIGNPDFANCFDPCVTGESQPAVSEGYWMMLKPLTHGQHTLHFHAEVPDYGFALDVTYNITVP